MDESLYLDIKDDNIAIGFPFAKIDVKTRTVEGYATLDNVDKSSEIVDFNASKEAFANWLGNIREMHGAKAVGKALNFEEKPLQKDGKSYNGMWVRAYISKGAQDTWEKILDGTLKGFSIGGRVLEKRPEVIKNDGPFSSRNVLRITKYVLGELSVVDNPANPLAMFGDEAGVSKRSLIKFADGAIQASDVVADEYKIFYCSQCDVAKVEDYALETTDCLTCDKAMELAGITYEIPSRDEVHKLLKREFSTKERERLSGTGAALPDGSFPIVNESDLRNAISAYGRAGDKARAKAHIIRRAKALGRTDLIPDAWRKYIEKVDSKEIFDSIMLSEDNEIAKAEYDGPMWTTPADPTPPVENVEVEEKADTSNDLQLNDNDGKQLMNLLNQLLEFVSKRSGSETETEENVTPVEGGEKEELDKETNLNGILDVLKAAVANVEEIITKWNVTRLNSEDAKEVEVAKPASLPGTENNPQLQVPGSNGAEMGTPVPAENNVVPHSPDLGKSEEETETEASVEKAEEKTEDSEEKVEATVKAVSSEDIEKVTSKIEDAFSKVAEKFDSLEERLSKVEGTGATKKSGEVNDVEDLKKSDSTNSFWGGSFAPTPYVG